MSEKKIIIPGRYKHFKGNEYEVLYIGLDSENKKEMVVYKAIKDGQVWVRPSEMFLDKVENDGQIISRFELLNESAESLGAVSEGAIDWEDKYKRALAELENFRKITEKEKVEFVKYANQMLIMEILPIYDNLKMSIQNLSPEQAANPWVTGVKHVIKQFADTLKNIGVEEIDSVGKIFDPECMEAVKGQGEKVKVELRPGYRLNGKVLIAARVELD